MHCSVECHFQWVDSIKPQVDEHCLVGQVVAASESTVYAQGWLQNHAEFWLNELQPIAFVAGIVTKGYQLPFMRMLDPVGQMNLIRECLICYCSNRRVCVGLLCCEMFTLSYRLLPFFRSY